MSEGKVKVDWEGVEREYRAGQLSLSEIGTQYGITKGRVSQVAKRDGWIRGFNAKIQNKKVILANVDNLNKPGFVYGVYLDDSSSKRYYKIGMTGMFSSRFQVHKCASPFDICVAFAYYVGNMRQEERFLHTKFAENRIRGEWFDLSNEELQEISQRALLV